MYDLAGATLWARKTLESDIFFRKPDKWFKIWFYLVSLANHKDQKQYKRGEVLTTYKEISFFTGASKNQIDHCIRYLKEAQMCATRKTTRGMFISMLNYGIYQDLNNYRSDTQSDKSAKRKRNGSDTINKNDNNDNKNTNTCEPSSQKVVTPINQVFDVFYKSINPTINYGNKTSREACEWMIEHWGLEKTIEVAKYACAIHGQRFSPTITTPYELKDKISKLKAFREQREAQKPQGVTILRKPS